MFGKKKNTLTTRASKKYPIVAENHQVFYNQHDRVKVRSLYQCKGSDADFGQEQSESHG